MEPAVIAFGAILVAAHEPLRAVTAIVDHLHAPDASTRRELERFGITSSALDDFRALFPTDLADLTRAASSGAYWALGHRARRDCPERWFPVMSGTELDPAVFDRRTGETLVALITRARQCIRLFSAYVDGPGLRALEPAIAGATRRGVTVELVTVRRLERPDVPEVLASLLVGSGDTTRLRIHRLEKMAWFPHLKLLTTDGIRAYIGSANMTIAGMTTNFEVGALVEGAAVIAYDALVDELMRRAQQETEDGGSVPPLP